MGWNQFGAVGAEALAQGVLKGEQEQEQQRQRQSNRQALKQNQTGMRSSGSSNSLIYLDCQGNSMGEEGALAFAKVVPQYRCLRDLCFAHNSVGAVGLLALADALETTTAGTTTTTTTGLAPAQRQKQKPPTNTYTTRKQQQQQAVHTEASAPVGSSSSLKQVILGDNKILAPEMPWVLNLRAQCLLENQYLR